MSAHSTTSAGITAAIMGTPRVQQTVRVCRATFSGSPLGPQYVVLVTPKGGTGTEYECGRRALEMLRNGVSPEELELETFVELDEDDAEDIGPSPESLRRWYEGRVL